MGANSIDISQYRSRIGTFSGQKPTCSKGKVSLNKTLNITMKDALKKLCISVNPGILHTQNP